MLPTVCFFISHAPANTLVANQVTPSGGAPIPPLSPRLSFLPLSLSSAPCLKRCPNSAGTVCKKERGGMERTFRDPGVGKTLLCLSVTAACPRAPLPAAVMVVEEVGVTGLKVGRHLVSSKPQHLVSLAPLQAGGLSLPFPVADGAWLRATAHAVEGTWEGVTCPTCCPRACAGGAVWGALLWGRRVGVRRGRLRTLCRTSHVGVQHLSPCIGFPGAGTVTNKSARAGWLRTTEICSASGV